MTIHTNERSVLAARTILGLAVGAGSIVALRFLSEQALMSLIPDAFSETGANESLPLQIVMLGYALLYSLFGGYVTATIAGRAETRHALALAVIHLLLGIFTVAESFERAPLWWHLVYLAVVAPGILLGGYMRANQAGRSDRVPLRGDR
ncbi:MAG: hypothetical protein ACR2G6_15980 [Gemmatimonadaceae bacterium]